LIATTCLISADNRAVSLVLTPLLSFLTQRFQRSDNRPFFLRAALGPELPQNQDVPGGIFQPHLRAPYKVFRFRH